MPSKTSSIKLSPLRIDKRKREIQIITSDVSSHKKRMKIENLKSLSIEVENSHQKKVKKNTKVQYKKRPNKFLCFLSEKQQEKKTKNEPLPFGTSTADIAKEWHLLQPAQKEVS